MVSISFGCGYWGAFSAIDWDSNTCANVLDGNTGTAYGATVSAVNAQAQFGVMTRLRFIEGGNPIDVDGYIKLHAYNWGSPAVASGIVGWGFVNPDTGEMTIIESFDGKYQSTVDQMLLYRLPEYAGWDYAVFSQATGTYSVMSGATAKIREIEFVELWYSTPLPTAAFTASPRVGFAPLTVEFTDLSSYAGAWLWEFGDGDTSDVQHPTHTYEYPGLYSVALTVANYKGQDTAIQEDYILVLPGHDGGAARRRRAAWMNMERPAVL
ncbi:MAG TPA: PKD domain-containing protein [Methanoculleus thermophilus]|nr:PKD domain-containing protein [Methanoculleus thermophilus]